MTQITFSSDVSGVSTDSNADNSIRWHVYERESLSSPGDRGIYLRREVNSNLEPEKQIVSIGEKPKIYFLANNWILLFKLRDRIAKISYAEQLDPVITIIPSNQIGNAGAFAALTPSLEDARIVFRAICSGFSSLSSSTRVPAIGDASGTSSLVGFSDAPEAFIGTRAVRGEARLQPFIFPSLVKQRIRESASSSASLTGSLLKFPGQTAIGATNASLEGVVLLSGTSVVFRFSGEANGTSSLNTTATASGISPTNVTAPEFTDSSVFNVGRTIEVTEGTWDGDPDPTI